MDVLVDLEFPSISGFAADSVHMGFAIATQVGWSPTTEIGELTIPIASFFNASQPNAEYVRSYISHEISRAAAACKFKIYDLAGALNGGPHGSPIAEDTMTLGAAFNDGAFPSQIANVLTLNGYPAADPPPVETADGADPGTAPDRPLQRHRGRLFVGPLMSNAGEQGAGVAVRPTATFQTTLRQAANGLRDTLTVDGHSWAVWSRANGALYPVESVSTDNRFDTQRRRALTPTVRTQLIVI